MNIIQYLTTSAVILTIIMMNLMVGTMTAQEMPMATTDILDERFDRASGKILDEMCRVADDNNMQGAAVLAFIPSIPAKSWRSRAQAATSFITGGKSNVLAIAYAKAAQMADTLRNSGDLVRPRLRGEYNYQGGALFAGLVRVTYWRHSAVVLRRTIWQFPRLRSLN